MADKKISALTSATTPLAGTEVLPIVQSGATVKVANNDLRPKQIQSNATSGVLQVVGPSAATTRVMTTPDANFTAARTDAGQTFTGTQVFTSPNIVTSINDSNGNEVFGITATASAVNEITVTNAITTNSPIISATGGDTNIGIRLTPKGNGDVRVTNGNLVIGTGGNGIDFSADGQAAGMTSELLDDYEEGTWTPTYYREGTAVDLTYGTRNATYTRIGRLVTLQCFIAVSAVIAQGTGFWYISGIPFNANAGTLRASGIRGQYTSGIFNVNMDTLFAAGGNNIINLGVDGAASNSATISTGNYSFTMTYEV